MPTLEPLTFALDQFYRQGRFASRHKHYVLWEKWQEMVGPRMAARAMPVGFAKGVLTVRVAESVWMQELSLHREELLAKAKALSGVKITDIRFVWGEQDAQPLPSPVPAVPGPTRRPLPEPTPQEVALAQAIAARVEDEGLRASLTAVVLTDLLRLRASSR